MANAATAILSRFERFIPRQTPRSLFLYALYTVSLFLLFLILTFPHDLVARQLAREIAADTGWEVQFDEAWFVPWDGYRFSNVELLTAGAKEAPWIGARRVSLRPSLATLFGGRLSAASFRGQAYGGSFTGRVRVGESSSLDLAWADLDLASYPHLAKLVEGAWAGRFSGELSATFDESVRDAEGRGKVTLRDGALTGGNAVGFTIPDLTSVRGDGEFEVKAGRLEVRALKLTGTEIDADLRGQIYLRSPVSESVVNTTLSVKPVPGTPPGVESLLTLMNRGQKPPGGTYSFTLYGMLSRVRIR